jgi:hypothetical protein
MKHLNYRTHAFLYKYPNKLLEFKEFWLLDIGELQVFAKTAALQDSQKTLVECKAEGYTTHGL